MGLGCSEERMEWLPAGKGRSRTLISFYIPVSSSIFPPLPQHTGFFGVVADRGLDFSPAFASKQLNALGEFMWPYLPHL